MNYNFGKISTQASKQNENIDFGTFLSSESSLSGLDYRIGRLILNLIYQEKLY